MDAPPREEAAAGTDRPVVYLSRQDQRSIAITGMFVLMAFFAVYVAAPVLIPITLAILLNLVLWPPVRLLSSLGLPHAISAAAVVGLVVFAAGVALYSLSGPAQGWLERTPASFYKVEQKLRALKRPIEETKRAVERVEQATQIGEDPSTTKVKIERPGLADTLFSGTLQTMASVGVVFVLLFFLLSSGDAFLRKLVTVIPSFEDKKRAVEIMHSIRDDIAFYLLTITAVNTVVGAMTAVLCLAFGVADPLMWGAMAALLSYVPYVGPAILAGLLSVEGMLTFEGVWLAFGFAASYLATVTLANTIILPVLLGRRLTLSPVAIFVSVILWGWLWGIPGALLAVPLLASFKILCERIVPLRPIAEFLTP